MKHNMLKLSSHDYVRRMASALLAPYPADLLPRELAVMVPEYKIVLPAGSAGKQLRFLATLTTRTHGKKRIYSEVGTVQNPLHLYYVSKNDVRRLARRTNREEAACATLIDIGLTDRWCVAFGRPICACRNLNEWLRRVVCLEARPTKSNHPPVGDTVSNSVWKFGPFYEQALGICSIGKRTTPENEDPYCSISRSRGGQTIVCLKD